jgi:hypothetical protein
MTTSCPYCGATLNLNYCVVCGRQSNPSINKMGSLKSAARNTDITKRLDDPLQAKKYRHQQIFMRLKRAGAFLLKMAIGGVVIAALVIIIISQAANLVQMQNMLAPWMKSHRLVFPNEVPSSVEAFKASLLRAPLAAKNKQKLNTDKHNNKVENPKTKAASK